MIAIFDLDYTLLDSAKFKEDLASVFFMSSEEWALDYKKNFKDKLINYNIDKHLDILKKEGRLKNDEKIIKEKLEIFLKRIDDYLFPKAEEVLQSFKVKGYKLALLTFGDVDFHKLKVENLNINRLFDEIVYEDKNKDQNIFLNNLKQSEGKIAIINDNARESMGMLDCLGEKAVLYLIKGPYSKNIPHKEKIYNNIAELL